MKTYVAACQSCGYRHADTRPKIVEAHATMHSMTNNGHAVAIVQLEIGSIHGANGAEEVKKA